MDYQEIDDAVSEVYFGQLKVISWDDMNLLDDLDLSDFIDNLIHLGEEYIQEIQGSSKMEHNSESEIRSLFISSLVKATMKIVVRSYRPALKLT